VKTALKHQQGLTFVSLVFLLGVLAAVVLLIFKIGPIYMDHSKVASAVAQLKDVDGIENQTEYQIRDGLRKQFSMNYIDVNPEDISIVKSGGYLKVTIAYEVVKPLVGNLSVLVNFNDEIEVGG
jgi:hypothetical protein